MSCLNESKSLREKSYLCTIGHLKIFQRGGSRLEDIIVEGGQPNDDKKKTKGGRGVKNGRNLVDVIYGCPPVNK